MLAIMKAGIKIPKTHEPEEPHRVLTEEKEKAPDIKKETAAVLANQTKFQKEAFTPTDSDTLAVLESIEEQLVGTNDLLRQIRNVLLNQPANYKIPEEVISNGE